MSFKNNIFYYNFDKKSRELLLSNLKIKKINNFFYFSQDSFLKELSNSEFPIIFLKHRTKKSISKTILNEIINRKLTAVIVYNRKDFEDLKYIEKKYIHDFLCEEDINPTLLKYLFNNLIKYNELNKKFYDKSSEKELKNFSRIVHQNPASIIITDVSGKIEFVNSKFVEVTGYSRKEVLGANPRILKSGAQTKEYYKKLWDTILKGESWKGELQNKRKNGEFFWEIASISPIRDDNQKITHFIAVKEDITEMKYVEEALQETKEKLRILFEALSEGIAVIDLEGLILQVNESFINLFGFSSRREILGKFIFELFNDENKKNIINDIAEIRKNKKSILKEYKIFFNDSNEKYFDVSIGLIRDRDGNETGYVVLIKGITERKEAEKALVSSEERNREILESIPDIMFRIDSNGKNLDRSLDYRVKKLFPDEIVKNSLPVIKSAIEKREIKIIEYPVFNDGVLNYYEARFIVNDENEIIVILRNIDDKITAEEQLKKARDDAESANRAKSLFLANMSHEIRTPLNSIMGFIELIQKTELNENQSEFFKLIRTSANNLLGVINDILDFSKIESGKLEIDNSKFDPLKEFTSLIELFAAKALEKNIQLLSFLDPLLPLCLIGDPLRIKQVLVNLLSNAIKFTQSGGIINLDIIVIKKNKKNCNIKFSVRDNGIGIDDNKKNRIFEAFSQADSGVTRKFGGTGLGLSICMNLVELMNGNLELETKKGEGSCFYFFINLPFCSENKNKSILKIFRTKTAAFYSENSIFNEYESNILKYLNSLKFNIIIFKNIKDLNENLNISIVVIVNNYKAEENIVEKIHKRINSPIVIVNKNGIPFKKLEKIKGNYFLSFPVYPDILLEDLCQIYGLKKQFEQVKQKDIDNTKVVYKNSKILVAEDNKINQKLIKHMLNEFGIEVDIAGNGLEVYDKMINDKYDLIFMDSNMPLYDGIETTKMIRDYELKNNLKRNIIVALTAKAIKGSREQFLDAGMDDYLSKPVSLFDLEKIFKKYLPGKAVNVKVKKDVITRSRTQVNYKLKENAVLLGISDKILKELIGDFFNEMDLLLKNLKEAFFELDYEKVYQVSHKIKGMSGNLKFDLISEEAEKIELKSQNKEEFNYKRMLNKIENTLKSYKKIVDKQM